MANIEIEGEFRGELEVVCIIVVVVVEVVGRLIVAERYIVRWNDRI